MKITQENYQSFDPYFTVKTLEFSDVTPMYLAMHQDYSSHFVSDENKTPSNIEDILINNLLKGDRGHYGVLEHSLMVFNCGYFPHSVIQQARTHRTISFDVSSFRFTGKSIYELGEKLLTDNNLNSEVEKTIYLRPIGSYIDRQGVKYNYTEEWRNDDLEVAKSLIKHYYKSINNGACYEHARGLLPFDYRQHFVVSFNIRSLMHFLDLRHKPDAQLEIQVLSAFLFAEFQKCYPILAEWYEKNRLNKGRLAP